MTFLLRGWIPTIISPSNKGHKGWLVNNIIAFFKGTDSINGGQDEGEWSKVGLECAMETVYTSKE